MAIDPDVEVELDAIKTDLQTHKESPHGGSPGPVPLPDVYAQIPPNTSAKDVNAVIAEMSRVHDGGTVTFIGNQKPEEPYRNKPGVVLQGAGYPTMYSDSQPRITPTFSNDAVFRIENTDKDGKRHAWGGSQLRNIQIDPQTPGLTAIHMVGGNCSHVQNIASTRTSHPLLYGLLVEDGQKADGQYSVYEGLRWTRAKHGATFIRNAPDTVMRDCIAYGDDTQGSTGLEVNWDCRNMAFHETCWQFYDKGLTINTREVEVTGGCWENRSGQIEWASYAIKLGPRTRDVTVRNLSIANLSSLKDVFVLHSDAHRYTFDLLSGHVNPSDVPPGKEKHFRWHAA